MAQVANFDTSNDKLHARMLLARFSWPVPMVRLRTAQAFAELLRNEGTRQIVKREFLDFLESRKLESEVSDLLFVVITYGLGEYFKFDEISGLIGKSSVLIEYILSEMFPEDYAMGDWYKNHSELAPTFFTVHDYFKRNDGRVLPLIFKSSLEDIEKATSLPLMKQWEYEWHQEMCFGDHVYSGDPNYFFRGVNRNQVGQFDVRQREVFITSFLRTLNFAVDHWGMPNSKALHLGLLAIPLSPGLAQILPKEEPSFLKKSKPNYFDEKGLRFLLMACSDEFGTEKTILNVDTTLKGDDLDKSDCRITLFFSKGDLKNVTQQSLGKLFDRSIVLWGMNHQYNYFGVLDDENIEKYKIQDVGFSALPIVLNTYKMFVGRWNHYYFSRGIRLPASYNFDHDLIVKPTDDGLSLCDPNGKLIASWKVWHSDWDCVYEREGDSNCGMITLSHDNEIFERATSEGYSLTYVARIRRWTKEKEYSDSNFSETFIAFPFEESNKL